MEIVSSSRTEEQVLAYIDNQQEGLVRLVREIVRYCTITPRDQQQVENNTYIEMVDYFSSFLYQIGIVEQNIWEQDPHDLEVFPGSGVNVNRDLSRMPILAAEIKGTGGGRSLILNGHYDVVPIGDLSAWKHDPFLGGQAGGRIYGRGSCDMKGGIAAMLMALQALQELGIRLSGDVIVQIVPDEEMTCMGTLACCQRGYTADAALIPEPTDMRVLIAMRGSFYGQIIVPGKAGHAEMVQPDWTEGGAVNPIEKASLVLQAIDELNRLWQTREDKQHALVDPDQVVLTSISGGGDWAVTYPEEVTLSFGVMTASDALQVRQELEDHILNKTGKDSWLAANPPIFDYEPVWHYGAEISPEEPIVKLGLDVLERLGYPPKVCGMGSLTDAIHLINYSKVPTISIGPAGQPAHMLDEYVEIKELVDLTKAIAMILINWCGVEGGN